MGFFNDLGNAFNDAAKTVSNKTNEVVEVTKLNNHMNDCIKRINQKYIEMGKKVYEEYKNEPELFERYQELCMQIDEIQKDLEETKDKISNVKGCKICKNCNNTVAIDSKFCPKCGNEFE